MARSRRQLKNEGILDRELLVIRIPNFISHQKYADQVLVPKRAVDRVHLFNRKVR